MYQGSIGYAIIILHITAAEALKASIQRNMGNDGFNRARKVVIRDKDRQLRGSYHVESTKDQSIELIVDDLVEKVKDRLKSELKMITASQGSIANPEAEEQVNPREALAAERKKRLREAKLLQDKLIRPTYLPLNELEAGYQPTEEPTAQNIRPKIGLPKIKRKKTTPDTRYLAEVFTARPPKYLLEYGPPKLLKNPTTSDTKEIKRIKKTYTTEDIETEVTESTPLTTEDTGAFVGFDLVNTNDSYEDYVTPKKDIDYKEPESQTMGYEIGNKGRQSKIKNRQKMLNDFETANQAMTKTKNRVNLEEFKIEDNVNYEQTMLGDFDRANKAAFEKEDLAYKTTGDKLQTKHKQKALDDFYRAKQLMSKIKSLNNVDEENKNSEILGQEAVRDFDNLNKAVSYIKDPVFSNILKQDDNINDERVREIGNIEMGMKSYPEQLKLLELANNNANKKITINNKNVNLFEGIKIRKRDDDFKDNDTPKREITNRGFEMAGPILRARKNVDALVEETQPEILKRRKSFDNFNDTDFDTNETFNDDDFEAISLNKLVKRILGNGPMKKTKIYLINLA